MFKFFHAESKTIIGAAAIVGIFSFLSRIVGFIRDRILAGTFGAGDTLDVYYAAFKIPDLLFSLVVVGALSASFIPLFSKQYYGLDRSSAWKFTNAVLHIVGLSMIVVCAILFLFAQPVSALIAPGFNLVKQQGVAEFMRIMLLAQILLGCSMVFGSVLQSLKQYVLYAFAPVLYNIGIMFGAIWLSPWLGPIGLAWGVVVGALLHMLIQFVGCFHAGYRYERIVDTRSAQVKTLLHTTGPRILGIALSQLLFLVMAVLASTMSAGSVTILQFAYNIQFFPVGIVGVSLAIAAFPLFAESLGANDFDSFRRSFSSTIRQALFFLIPVTLLFLVLRAQLVRLVVGAGAFDWESTILTADTLAFFALTIIPQSGIYILTRAFFALHDTMTPLTAGLIGALVGLISGFLFREPFGVVGLGMAYSLYAIVNLVLLWVPLRQRIGSLSESVITQSLMKLAVAGIVCGVLAQLVKPLVSGLFSLETFFGVFMQASVAGGIGVLGYLTVAWMLRSPEMHAFAEAMQRKILRKIQPKEPVELV